MVVVLEGGKRRSSLLQIGSAKVLLLLLFFIHYKYVGGGCPTHVQRVGVLLLGGLPLLLTQGNRPLQLCVVEVPG